MFVLGHLGIGSKIAAPWKDRFPRHALLLGTVLPDLIDKPLYYGIVAVKGYDATLRGLISGTRTFGHTAIFLAVLALLSLARRSSLFLGLAAGTATHLLIDNVGDWVQMRLGLVEITPHQAAWYALLWPLLGGSFPSLSPPTILSHLGHLRDPWIMGGEIVGLLILTWDYLARQQLLRSRWSR